MSSTLIAHRGAKIISKEQLKMIPPPEGTSTWKPVAHDKLLSVLENEVQSRGMTITKTQLAVQRDGTMFFGILDLKSETDYGDYTSSLGIRAGNNRKMSIQIAVGARVFVCDNLAFSGAMIALKRKHTSKLSVEEEIKKAIERYKHQFALYSESIEQQKTIKLTDSEARSIMFRAFEERDLPIKLFHNVITNYFEPEHVEFKPRTLWSLNNAFTESVKSLPEGRKFFALAKVGKLLETARENLLQ